MSTRPIRLPGGATGAPEIFAGGACGAVRRAVVIGNGCAGAESQCLSLVRALGLADGLTLYCVTRPTGGINKWLHFPLIFLHKLVDEVFRHVLSNVRFTTVFQGKRLAEYPVHNGQSCGLSSVLEADTKKIVTMVHDTFEKGRPGNSCCLWPRYHIICKFNKVFSSRYVFVTQIQHPRSCLDMFDLVVTPRRDYYALTATGQQEVPRLFWRWITPQEPPGPNVTLPSSS